MLLLHTFIDEFFNNAEAVTELSFVDVFIILSSKRFVFFRLELQNQTDQKMFYVYNFH